MLHSLGHVFFLFTGHIVNALQISGNLERQYAGKLGGLTLLLFLQDLLFHVQVVLELGEFVDDLLRRSRIFLVNGVVEDAGQSVVVGLRNRIVLMIVAAGARNRETQEPAGDRIHAVVPLIGARNLIRAIVVIPRAETEEAGAGQHLIPDFRVHQVPGELRLDELIVGHVVVERLDHPVAVCVGVGIWAITLGVWIQTAVIVFAIPRHVQPDTAPALAIVWGCKQTVHHFRKSVRGRVLFKSRRLLRSRRQAGEIQRGPSN